MSRARNRPAGEVQVGERQQREHLCGVLVEAAIAHLAVAELALHATEHMPDLREAFPEAAIAGTLVSRRVVHAAAGDARRVHEPASGINADVRLHAEVPLIALL